MQAGDGLGGQRLLMPPHEHFGRAERCLAAEPGPQVRPLSGFEGSNKTLTPAPVEIGECLQLHE